MDHEETILEYGQCRRIGGLTLADLLTGISGPKRAVWPHASVVDVFAVFSSMEYVEFTFECANSRAGGCLGSSRDLCLSYGHACPCQKFGAIAGGIAHTPVDVAVVDAVFSGSLVYEVQTIIENGHPRLVRSRTPLYLHTSNLRPPITILIHVSVVDALVRPSPTPMEYVEPVFVYASSRWNGSQGIARNHVLFWPDLGTGALVLKCFKREAPVRDLYA